METIPDRSGRRLARIAERIGTPGTVAALGLLVVTGICVAFIVLLRLSADRAGSAERSVEIAQVSDAAIDVFAEAQKERGLARLLLATGSGVAGYEDQLEATDRAIARFERIQATTTIDPDEVLGEALGTDLPPLGPVREAILAREAEERATGELYGGIVDKMRSSLTDIALLATDATDVRLRRASLNLLAAADVLSRRRALVITITAAGAMSDAETALQLSLYARELAVDLDAAAGLLSGDLRDRVAALSVSSVAVEANELLGAVLTAPGGVEPRRWFDAAGAHIDELIALASALNDDISDRAVQRADNARRTMLITGAAVGVLFLLALLAAWSSIVASRGRARALGEHRQLVAGLLQWFGSEARPEISAVDVAARYLPADALSGAGGDWYDVFADGDDRLGLVVGDVAGHGAGTVARMAEVRNMVRALAFADLGGPARQLEVVDAAVDALHLTTVFYAVVDVPQRSLTYSRAGHVPGVLRRADGSVEVLYHGADTPLGVRPVADRTQATEQLGIGDTIVLFTDGVVEDPTGDVLDEIGRLAKTVIAPHSGAVDDLADRLLENRPATMDDASVLIVRLGGSVVDGDGRQQTGDLEDANDGR